MKELKRHLIAHIPYHKEMIEKDWNLEALFPHYIYHARTSDLSILSDIYLLLNDTGAEDTLLYPWEPSATAGDLIVLDSQVYPDPFGNIDAHKCKPYLITTNGYYLLTPPECDIWWSRNPFQRADMAREFATPF